MTATPLQRLHKQRYSSLEKTFPCTDLFQVAQEFGGTGMEAAPRPPQDINGAKQNSDNPESQPKDRKRSLDRKISFDAAIAEPESTLGGATEAGGS